ncbi:MAG: T9SS type A sorting domain-containing protein [Flavobacteriales bacterium]|nr:T9SS type A sorting domain-containing protein [Flavobacteriales bacterium]
MRRIFLGASIIALNSVAVAQDIPNGGFELWDSTFFEVGNYLPPVSWFWGQANSPCYPLNALAVPDPSSHSGVFSVKLENMVCVDDNGNARLEEGNLYTGTYSLPPLDQAFSISSRPETLEFHYKFHQEGNDSAYVRVMLFNYDSLTPGLTFDERFDTLAYTTGYINVEATSFTPFSLPITYFSSENAAFMHIYFSTSKTLTEGYGNTPPYLYGYPGTALWLDDVHLSGGDVGVSDIHARAITFVYPNPAHDVIRFSQPCAKAMLYDGQGRIVRSSGLSNSQSLDISGLSQGLYVLELSLQDGTAITERIVVE